MNKYKREYFSKKKYNKSAKKYNKSAKKYNKSAKKKYNKSAKKKYNKSSRRKIIYNRSTRKKYKSKNKHKKSYINKILYGGAGGGHVDDRWRGICFRANKQKKALTDPEFEYLQQLSSAGEYTDIHMEKRIKDAIMNETRRRAEAAAWRAAAAADMQRRDGGEERWRSICFRVNQGKEALSDADFKYLQQLYSAGEFNDIHMRGRIEKAIKNETARRAREAAAAHRAAEASGGGVGAADMRRLETPPSAQQALEMYQHLIGKISTNFSDLKKTNMRLRDAATKKILHVSLKDEAYKYYLADSKRLILSLMREMPTAEELKGGNEGVIKFFRAIFNNISSLPYAVEKSSTDISKIGTLKGKNIDYKFYVQQDGYKKIGVPRRNHGVLNHFRSVLFCVKTLTLLKINSRDLYRRLFPSELHLNLVIIGSVFCSLLRESETDFGETFSLDEETLEMMFPCLYRKPELKEVFNGSHFSIQKAFSAALYVTLFKTIFKGDEGDLDLMELIEHIAIGSMMAWTKSGSPFLTKVYDNHNKPTDLLIPKGDGSAGEYEKYYFYGNIVGIGHWLDHARCCCSFPMINGPSLKILKQRCGLQDHEKHTGELSPGMIEKISLQDFVVNTLLETEYAKDNYDPKKDPNRRASMQERCNYLKKSKTRYKHKDFKRLSKDFDLCIKRLDLINSIASLKK